MHLQVHLRVPLWCIFLFAGCRINCQLLLVFSSCCFSLLHLVLLLDVIALQLTLL